MLENIESILTEKCGLSRDLPIIAGVSGGPDSLCLMNILREAGYRIIVAHFNHKLRPDSDTDANIVEQTAARLNLVSVIHSGDVRAFAEAGKHSVEEAARILRYRFLMEQAHHFHAQAVAVGHTADDQVETVLMHFIRGAGLAGLKGMNYRTIIRTFDPDIPVVRPLLDVWRQVVASDNGHGMCADDPGQPSCKEPADTIYAGYKVVLDKDAATSEFKRRIYKLSGNVRFKDRVIASFDAACQGTGKIGQDYLIDQQAAKSCFEKVKPIIQKGMEGSE